MSNYPRLLAIVAGLLVCAPNYGPVQDPKSEDLEKTRAEMLKRWGLSGLAKASDVDAKAASLLKKSLTDQSIEDLEHLAKQANTVGNLVGFILGEYQQYYRDNYRYEFIQKKVAPFHDEYVALSNKFFGYRNQAYFNLGKKALERGDEVTAFFMFRDAFRLSSFTDDKGDHKGIRYQAEIEMKKLIGVEGSGTFIHWE